MQRLLVTHSPHQVDTVRFSKCDKVNLKFGSFYDQRQALGDETARYACDISTRTVYEAGIDCAVDRVDEVL